MDISLLLLAFWVYQTSQLPKQIESPKFEPIVIPSGMTPAVMQCVNACVSAVAL